MIRQVLNQQIGERFQKYLSTSLSLFTEGKARISPTGVAVEGLLKAPKLSREPAIRALHHEVVNLFIEGNTNSSRYEHEEDVFDGRLALFAFKKRR